MLYGYQIVTSVEKTVISTHTNVRRAKKSEAVRRKESQLFDAWNTKRYQNKSDLARENDMTEEDVIRAIDAERKRREDPRKK